MKHLKWALPFILVPLLYGAKAKLWIPLRCMTRIDLSKAKCKDISPDIMSCSNVLIEHHCVSYKHKDEDTSRLSCKAEE